MPIKKATFLKNKDVKQFIEFLARVIDGSHEVKHQYWDQGLARRKRPIRQEADRRFNILEDAFNEYYWPKYEHKFKDNLKILKPLKTQLSAAKTEPEAYYAASRVLWWGAGNSGQSLYKANMDWINQMIDSGTSTLSILDGAKKRFDADPFDEEQFDGKSYRSNAGLTKVYALRRNDFVIYDSRVAAGLGLIVVRFCKEKKMKKLPENLELGWSRAKYVPDGQKEPLDDRNPSKGSLKFPPIGDGSHSLHARSNWRANLFLRGAIALLKAQDRTPSWLTSGDPLRKVEAALFMLGKDIPSDRRKFPTTG